MKRKKTFSARPKEIVRKWHVIDAKGQTLGRLAGRVAGLLMGKGKAIFTPNQDCGDFVIVVNAKNVVVTGNKEEQKIYFSHSGYPGGHKLLQYKDVIVRSPRRVIYQAVRGMLPSNILGGKMVKKLKIYIGKDHPHLAQIKGEVNA